MIRRLLELLHLIKPRKPRLQQTDFSGSAWEHNLVGRNIHSVYTWCKDCHSKGINVPFNDECGNCGSNNTVRYYDKETIDLLFKHYR